ncbi:hypothetical protein SAMN05444483_10187 [Salegentibacter echinorum]|uniref:Uncharacterized protein n=1 Tax=Salegentibacter echinorum TaxID=1073325 RepID=A0A1M5BLT1_SALEC|nr:hypothetical protein [Salegentibacter echinorum]SHF43356.1 hypothetical protein SAMN05444483_10187 [Salegentibacter echinorum]
MVTIYKKEAKVYMVPEHKLDAKDYENLIPVITEYINIGKFSGKLKYKILKVGRRMPIGRESKIKHF